MCVVSERKENSVCLVNSKRHESAVEDLPTHISSCPRSTVGPASHTACHSEDLPRLENKAQKYKRKRHVQSAALRSAMSLVWTSTREESREQSRRRPLQDSTLKPLDSESTPHRPPGLSLGRDPSPWALCPLSRGDYGLAARVPTIVRQRVEQDI